ncbi:MAG: beta-L-arabinofuranosidase domain-containing protein [Bacteroidales bacterium]
MNPSRKNHHKSQVLIPLLGLLLLIFGCKESSRSTVQPQAGPEAGLRCEPFALKQVTLLEGPFLEATRTNARSLLQYEPDRLLARFRTEAGLEPRAEHYGGWEAMSLAGHSLGHYLSGCSLMYCTTGDTVFKNRAGYIVGELSTCQEANGSGYIGAFTDGERVLKEEVGSGEIHPSAFYLNGIWAPFYTMHKVMAGLRDAYRLCGYRQALEVEAGLADWLNDALGGLNDEEVQEMLKCEHGGMNEVLADLYADTGNETYMELSGLFYHKEILDPLSRGEDILNGKHGNTQIPKLIGLARRYEITGDTLERKTAEFFWDRVVNHHSYVNGSHGLHEYFGPADSLNDRLGSASSESCNVYNMLKLSMHLFEWTASPEVADYYERALINHILSSQHHVTGEVLYFHSLQMGGTKEFQNPFDLTCCIGTGMENHSKYGEAIYFQHPGELFVNLFIASELNWKETGVILRQETGFPVEEATRLLFLNEMPVKMTLQLRIPGWADERCKIRVNGKRIRKTVVPGTYLALSRKWTKGDRVEMEMPFPLHIEAMPDNPGRVALLDGPLVLAGDLGDHGKEHQPVAPEKIPWLVTGETDPEQWIEPVTDEPHAFLCTVAQPEPATLRPLYAINDQNFTVYWNRANEAEWQKHLQELREKEAELARIDEMTVDRVVPAGDPSAQGHRFRSENPGFYQYDGYPCIESRYGWFSFEMAVNPGSPAGLQVDYWGGFRGPREFVIEVNGNPIATEDLSSIPYNEPGHQRYTIPAALTSSGKVTITFRATEGHYAGPVFGIRTLRIVTDPQPVT